MTRAFLLLDDAKLLQSVYRIVHPTVGYPSEPSGNKAGHPSLPENLDIKTLCKRFVKLGFSSLMLVIQTVVLQRSGMVKPTRWKPT